MLQAVKAILINELKYTEYVAETTARDLVNLQPQLKPALDKWIADRTTTDITVESFSALQLMSDKGFTYPAALIAMDWLLTEPEAAKKDLASDINRQGW